MIHAFAQHKPKTPLVPYEYATPPLGPDDVEIKIEYCGLCHSDLHLIEGDWPMQHPLVPGHEIVGKIIKLGASVKHLQIGSQVGVGWQSSACLTCDCCLQGKETSCPSKVRTCMDRPGGLADKIIVSSQFVFPLPQGLHLASAAPLLCAGITVYTPLRAYAEPPHSVAIIGIGGLGHLALQFARHFGCEVTAISTTREKEAEAKQFGAHNFALLQDLKKSEQFDLILSTVHADLDWAGLLQLLKPSGKLCTVGLPQNEIKITARQLVTNSRSLCGSSTGSRWQMKEMLTFAARHKIEAKVEVMPMGEINKAIEILKHNRARYRVVLSSV